MSEPTTTGHAALRVRGLKIAYQDDEVVHGVDLDLVPGQRLGLVGESGSGKSTVARAVIGLLPATGQVTSGSLALHGTDLLEQDEKSWNAQRGRTVSLVFQDPLTSLDPVRSIGATLAEAVRTHDRDIGKADLRARCVELLDQVGIPEPATKLGKFPHEFSGGMRQRVLIAAAIAHNPSVLIADEPTTALDVTTQAQVLDLLRRLSEELSIGILLITHDLGVVAEFCDSVAVMNQGRIVETGPVAEIFSRPRDDYTRRLLSALPQRSRGGAPGLTKATEPDIVLRAAGLTKSFGRGRRRRAVLKGVDVELRRGESLGIVGESGAGKSTLARALMRLDDADTGSLHVGDHDFGRLRGKALRQARARVQMVFQDPFSSLDPRMKVEDLVAQPLQVHQPELSAAQRREQVVAILADMGLGDEYLSRRPGSMSGGQRQRVAIARALVVRPAIAVLDEPISALDVSIRMQVLQLLKAEQAKLGLSYLFVVHDLSVARSFCDRVAVLYEGEIVECRASDDLFDNPEHPYTRRLIAAEPDPWAAVAPDASVEKR